VTWWRRLLTRSRLERQLDREVADHIERQVHDNIRAGLSEEEARRQAVLAFGAIEAVKEECRDARGTRWLLDAARDTRHAVRQMRKHPASVLVAALSLGLSIGAVAAIFSLVDAVLLRPLPVAAPERLVLLAERAGDHDTLSWSMSQFQSFAQSPSLTGVCAFRPRVDFSVTYEGRAEVAAGQLLSGGCYQVLGLKPQVGRLFTDDDERAGDARPVAVISDRFWRRQYGSDPNVVGRPLELRGRVVTIVGVTPPGFLGLEPGRTIEISLPLSLQPLALPIPMLSSPRASTVRWLRLIGRLAPDASRDRATAELRARWAQLVTPPANGAAANRFELLDGAQGLSDLRTQFSHALRLLFGAVGLLLLLACANMASLTLARNQVRAGEVTLRLALGASRGRVVRQLFTESFVLSLIAGGTGLTIAFWASRTIVTLLSRGREPIVLSVGWDARVLVFTMLITLLASVLFGLWPALKASRADLHPDLQAGARIVTDSPATRWNPLIAAQTTLSVVLVIGAGLFARSLAGLYGADVGVDRRQVMLVTIGPGMTGDRNLASRVLGDFSDRLSNAAGVQAVTTAMDLPFSGSSYRAHISVPGLTGSADDQVSFNFVGPRFFETMGVPLLAGRDFLASDDARHPAVGVISRSLAQRYFEGADPIGRHLKSGSTDIEVVGVAKDVPYEGVRSERELVLYRPRRQDGQGAGTFVIRANLPAAALATLIRQTLHDVAPSVPVVSMTTLADQFDGSIASERLLADIAAFFGLMSLLLVAIGMYGTLASSLAQRTREFGVRRALGASDGELARMILVRALTPVSLGLAVGLPAAFVAARLAEAVLFGVTPHDPLTYAAGAGALLLVATLAATIPARSVTRMSVTTALRQTA
jgi:predicted permease